MNPYIKIAILFIIVIGIIILHPISGNDPKPINYEQKYDSLQQQLELERFNRITVSNTIDSLTLVSDSLINVKDKIQVEIRYIPGKYNQYNSTEIQQKMIEGYEQR